MEYMIKAVRRAPNGGTWDETTVRREYDEKPDSGSIIEVDGQSYAILLAIPDHVNV